MQEITSYGNMSEAFDRVLRGKKRKKCRQGRYLLAHREEVIAELTAKLADGSFRLGNYHERIICENGTKPMPSSSSVGKILSSGSRHQMAYSL